MTILRWGVGLWLCALPILSAMRVPLWASDLALWQDAQRQAPQKVRPLLNIANVFAQRGELEIAEGLYRDVLVLAASRPTEERRTGTALALVNLAIVQAQQGRLDEARATIRDARRRFPQFREAQAIEGRLGG